MTLDEYMRLDIEGKRANYDELSERDKFRLRVESSVARAPRCSDCKSRINKSLSCKAHPEGLTAELINVAEKSCEFYQG